MAITKLTKALGVVFLVVASACASRQQQARNAEPGCTPSGSNMTCNSSADCCSGSCTYEGGYCR